MAITKIHPIRASAGNSLNYIMNKDKTTINTAPLDYVMDDNKTLETNLISTFGCDILTATDDFNKVLNHRSATQRTVVAQHVIQSFKPGEVSIENAHDIGVKLADEFLDDRFQYVVATHIDKEHIHNHIIFNNVSFENYKTYQSKRKNMYKLRDISDELCREYGLSVIEHEDKNKTRKDPKHSRSKYKNSFRNILKQDIDYTIKKSVSYDDFIENMKRLDYAINVDNKFTTFNHKTNGQQRNIRMERLGTPYSKKMIEYRINNEFIDVKKHEFKPAKQAWVKQVIDITSDEKYHTQPGLNHWAIRQNNQAIIETLNRMNQLGCGSYSQLVNYVTQLEEIYDTDTTNIREINVQINDLKQLIKRSENILEQFNLYEHAQALTGVDKETFIKDNDVDLEIISKFREFQNELFLEGYPIDSLESLRALIPKIKEELENKRSETRQLLSDQQKVTTMVNEMKHLANNYDRFIEKPERYPSEKDVDKER